MNMKEFRVKAPGRLCLFGEHQDYLGLPVIAMAIPLYCQIHCVPDPSSEILELKFVHDNNNNNETMIWKFDINRQTIVHRPASYNNDSMDFVTSVWKEAISSQGNFQYKLQMGAKCISTTTVPLQAGCSSSSAFCVAWSRVLAELSSLSSPPSSLQMAQLAHCGEVVHFGAPGGTMDHVTSATGGILRIGPGMWQIEQLSQDLPPNTIFVLAFSGEPKDTMKHLHRCKDKRLQLLETLGLDSWRDEVTVEDKAMNLSKDDQVLLRATLVNREMEELAAMEWKQVTSSDNETDDNLTETTTKKKESLQRLATYMMRHHEEGLRDGLELSTDRLESMSRAALEAGACAFKVVGSGGGGCGVAWVSTTSTTTTRPLDTSGEQESEKTILLSDVAQNVARAMKEKGGATQTWIFDKASQGVHICSSS